MKSKLNLLLGVSLTLAFFSPSLFATEILDTTDDITLLSKTPSSTALVVVESNQSKEEIDDPTGVSSHASSKTAVLPTEMLDHIFSFLSPGNAVTAAHVCKYWRTILTKGLYFSPMRIDSLESFNALYHPDIIDSEEAKEARQKVTHLVVDDTNKSIGNIDFREIITTMPRLRSITLHKARLSLPTVEEAEDAEKQELAPVSTGPQTIKFSNCEIVKHQNQATITDAFEEVGQYVASILLTSERLTEFKIQNMPGFFALKILPQLKRAINEPTFQSKLGSVQRPLRRLDIMDGFIKDIPAEFDIFPHLDIEKTGITELKGSIQNPQVIVKMKESENPAPNATFATPSIFKRVSTFASNCMHELGGFIKEIASRQLIAQEQDDYTWNDQYKRIGG